MTGSAGDRRRAVPPFLALGAFVIMLLAGMLVPVYSDEIGWRFQERAAVDGVDIMFNDLCGPNTLAAPPWFMMPVRLFSAAANQTLASPLFVRIEGIACALAWTGLLWLLTARLESNRIARSRLRAVLFSMLSLGILPFLMVMSRPEQPVILMLLLAIVTALSRRGAPSSALLASLKVAAILLFGWIAMSYHLKGVIYSPVFFACIAVCASGRRTIAPQLVAGAVLAALVLFSTQYWTHRFQCLGDPVLTAKLGKENVAALLANGGNWLRLAGSLLAGASPLNYIWLAAPAQTNDSWLPGPDWTAGQIAPFGLAMIALWGGLIVCALVELGRYGLRERLRALSEPRLLIALALAASLAAWGASQLHRNFYEASHYLPMMAVFAALCLTLPGPAWAWRERCLALLGMYGPAGALLSVAIILATGLGPMIRSTANHGWIPEQRIAVSAFGYGQVRNDIAKAMDRAGMVGGRRFNRLLIDDVTYLALQHHTFPLHRLGVLGDWKGRIADPVAYLRSRHSDGVVIGCRYLPPSMRKVAGRAGDVCAISRRGLDQLAASGPTRFGEGEEL